MSDNPNPVVFERRHTSQPSRHRGKGRENGYDDAEEDEEFAWDRIDALEVFEHVRDIRDPEHPYSLEQLNVVSEEAIKVRDDGSWGGGSYVRVKFTPTVMHCSMANLIGLCLRVKLMRSLPPRFKIDVRVAEGTHSTEDAINKQLNDKERVAAALENPHLLDMVESCLVERMD